MCFHLEKKLINFLIALQFQGNECFKLQGIVPAAPQGNGEVQVAFDPNAIGTYMMTLYVNSTVLGEYMYCYTNKILLTNNF